MSGRDRSAAGVLVSLKPEFASAVAEGRKTVELRRRFPRLGGGKWLVIYSTQPVGAVIGMARINEITVGSVSGVWRSHGSCAAISRQRYRSYFSTSAHAIAVVLGEFVPFSPVALADLRRLLPGFCAPQSWRYLDHAELSILRERRAPIGIAAGVRLEKTDESR